MKIDINNLTSKWKDFITKMNDKGIAVPTIRDPDTGEGSVSLTLVFISSFLVIVGILSKWSGKLGGVDIDNALQFFYASASLYFGRKINFTSPKGEVKASADKIDNDNK
jgi:hypothetical protein